MFVVIDSGCAQFCLEGNWSCLLGKFWTLVKFWPLVVQRPLKRYLFVIRNNNLVLCNCSEMYTHCTLHWGYEFEGRLGVFQNFFTEFKKEAIFWPLKMFFFPNIKENYSRIVYICLSLLTLVVHNFVWWWAIGLWKKIYFGPLKCFSSHI